MYMRKLTRQVRTDHQLPAAETKYGKLRGALVEGTYIFRGVPYAQAKRFRMPTPPQPWEGVRDALVFGYVCPELNTPLPHDNFHVPHYFYSQNENCHYLNIWTQRLDKTAKRPVMVWFHGGGWFSGSSLEIYSYDGENLSREKDVVVVSVNHRLNCLGFLDLTAYGEEYKDSANVGLADLVQSLRWIKENIASFGGDPDNVTLFGQSGGGAKVLSMLQTPAADGLYRRIVMQSGGARGSHEADFAQEKRDAQEFAALAVERLGLTKDTISQIDDVNWYDLAQAVGEATWLWVKKTGRRYNYGPQADGKYYFGHPGAAGFRKETLDVPVMCGSVFGEFDNNWDHPLGEGSKNRWDPEYTRLLAKEKYGADADAILSEFSKAYPDRPLADALFFAWSTRANNIDFCKMRAAVATAPTYNWLFSLEAPFMEGVVPWHNAEEPYVFRNAKYIESQYEPLVSEWMEDVVSGAWVSFATNDDPNHPGMPQWPVVTADECPTMVFDRECVVLHGDDDKLCRSYPPAKGGFPGSGIMGAVYGFEPQD